MKLRVFASLAFASLAAPASAHAFLDHANPGAGAVLHEAPKSVVLLFSEDLEADSSVQVVDASGHSVANGRAMVTGDRIVSPVLSLGPGKYRVVWHAVSLDNHRTEGAYEFIVER